VGEMRHFVCFLICLFMMQHVYSTKRFLQFSDLHFDPLYDIHQPITPNFCRKVGLVEYSEDDFEDIKKHSNHKFSQQQINFGRYGCDSPEALLSSAYKSVEPMLDDIEFIVVTGDFNAHYLPQSIVVSTLNRTVTQFKKAFPHQKIIFSLGNNDFYPNYGNGLNSTALHNWFQTIGPIFDNFLLDSNARATFRQGGYYSHELNHDLTIIALNTVLYSWRHNNYSQNNPDPLGQFRWLEGLLSHASLTGSKVYITGHIPPCTVIWESEQQWRSEYMKTYFNLTNIYSKVIAGQIFGHTHRDDFKVIYNDLNAPFASLLLSSSISPRSDTNPSYRVYSYSENDYTLLDYTHFYADLFSASDLLYWTPEYSFGEAYSQKNLGTLSLNDLLRALYSNAQIFNEWEARYVVSVNPQRQKFICSIRYSNREDYLKCVAEDISE